MTRRLLPTLCLIVLTLAPLLSSCGASPTATAATATAAPAQQPTSSAPSPSKVPPTATMIPPTATPPGPTVGGTLVIGLTSEPDTLDVQKSAMTPMELVMAQVGATLIARDPATGKLVPYLAESWTISSDGLTMDFWLRKGIKFHNGSPVTAQDYAWTLNRAIDPATRSLGTGAMLTALASAEAVDDSHLRLTLKTPSFPLLGSLAFVGYCSVLPKAAVEKLGDQFGRQPIGAGPFQFKEWKTGDKIVLERNPD
jgi:peptide/nickel transport system substrate-binding protein